MKHFLLSFFLLTITIACHGQQTNVNCAKNYSLYKEFMKVGSYDLAVEPYWELVNECPDFRQNLMRDGFTIYSKLLESTGNVATLASYLDSIKKLAGIYGPNSGDAKSVADAYLSIVQAQVSAGKVPVSRFYDDTEPLLQDANRSWFSVVANNARATDSSMSEFSRRYLPDGNLPNDADSIIRLKTLMEAYRLNSYPTYLSILERRYDVTGKYTDAQMAADWAKSHGMRQKAFAIYSKLVANLKALAHDDPKCYLAIASVYALNADLVPGDEFNRQCLYWVASDYAALGQKADPSMYHSIMLVCNGRTPGKSEAFMRSVLPGHKVSVKGFGPETTTARFDSAPRNELMESAVESAD